MEDRINAKLEKIEKLVEEFEEVSNEKSCLDEQEMSLKFELVNKQNQVKEQVFNELDEISGKKKYSNEDLRNIAVSNILEENDDYVKIRKASDKISSDLGRVKLKLEILSKKLSLSKTESDLIIALTNFKMFEGERL